MNGCFFRAAPARAAPVALGLLALLCCSQAVFAACPRPQDEIWFLDSRPAGCSAANADGLPKLTVEQLSPTGGCWQPADVQTLLSVESQTPTIIWVHGNRIDRGESREHGLAFYRALIQQAGDAPVRLVIWSWPADQVRGPLNDIRYKAQLTEPAAFHLARVLRHLNPATPLGLVGFSYGSRVITGALHLQAGGSLGAYHLPKQEENGAAQAAPRAVLWASALNNDWLLPGHYHGQALSQLQQATLLNNSCDRALKRYRFVDRCTRPEALGFLGISCPSYLGPYRQKVMQVDVCCAVGRVHDDYLYINNCSLMRRTWQGVTGETLVAKKQDKKAAVAKKATAPSVTTKSQAAVNKAPAAPAKVQVAVSKAPVVPPKVQVAAKEFKSVLVKK